MKLLKDEMYGKIIGKYTILERILTKDYHKKYLVKCNKCGDIIHGIELRNIDRTAFSEKCSHFNVLPETRVGKTYGKYTILAFEGYKNNEPLYKVRCNDCEYVYSTTFRMIKDSKEGMRCEHQNFWYSKKLSEKYHEMIRRCYEPNRQNYKSYGGKGITVCDEWLRSPWKFNEWAIANGYQDGLTIHRIDSTKGYSPDNCIWISMEDNRKWNEYSIPISVNGTLDTLSGWEKRLGLTESTLNYFYNGNSPEETALRISQYQNPDKLVIAVEIDPNVMDNDNLIVDEDFLRRTR